MRLLSSARALLVALVLLGLATHLPGLTHPRQVVFDEVHWGKFVSAYCCTGQRVFDVHPPHGKLLLALGAKLGGYTGHFSFESIGQPYVDEPVFFFRIVPALSGILIPALFMLLLRAWGARLPTAFLGGLALVFDNAILVETHTMLFDGILVAAILGSLVCLFAAEGAATSGRRLTLSASSGALAGLALGTKFTGLVALAVISIYLAARIATRREDRRQLFTQWLVIGLAAAVVYVGGWAIHFALLPNPGPGDAFSQLTGHFFQDLWIEHKTMLAVNFNLAQTHPDASAPWTWPLMKVAPYLWTDNATVIYLLGNPVVWWGSSVLLAGVVLSLVLMQATNLRMDPIANAEIRLWLPLFGYLIAFVPLFGVTRVLFLYHYLTPLVFAVAAGLLWLDRAGWITSDEVGNQRPSYYATIVVLIVVFLLITPVSYGFSLGTYDEWLAAAIRSWR